MASDTGIKRRRVISSYPIVAVLGENPAAEFHGASQDLLPCSYTSAHSFVTKSQVSVSAEVRKHL